MAIFERERFNATDSNGNEYTVLLIETTVKYGNRELPGALQCVLENGDDLIDVEEGQWEIRKTSVRIRKTKSI